jgi:hypothetical protein
MRLFTIALNATGNLNAPIVTQSLSTIAILIDLNVIIVVSKSHQNPLAPLAIVKA